MKSIFYKKFIVASLQNILVVYDKETQIQLTQFTVPVKNIDFINPVEGSIYIVSEQILYNYRINQSSNSDYQLELVNQKQLDITPDYIITTKNQFYVVNTQSRCLLVIQRNYDQQQYQFSSEFADCIKVSDQFQLFNNQLLTVDNNTNQILSFDIAHNETTQVKQFTTNISKITCVKNYLVVSTHNNTTQVFNEQFKQIINIQHNYVIYDHFVQIINSKEITFSLYSEQNQQLEVYRYYIDIPGKEGEYKKKQQQDPKIITIHKQFVQILLTPQKLINFNVLQLTEDVVDSFKQFNVQFVIIQENKLFPQLMLLKHQFNNQISDDKQNVLHQQNFKLSQIAVNTNQQQSNNSSLSRYQISNQLYFEEADKQQINLLEQAIRIEDKEQINRIIQNEQYELYQTLQNKYLKIYVIEHILNFNFSSQAIKFLTFFKEDEVVLHYKDEIYVKLDMLHMNKDLVEAITNQSAGQLVIANVEPQVIIEGW